MREKGLNFISIHANLLSYSSEAAPTRGPQQSSTALVPAPTSRTPAQRQPTSPAAPSPGAVLRQQEVRQVRSADGSQAVVVRQQEV